MLDDKYNPNNQNLMELYNRRLIEVEQGVNTYWLKYPVKTGVGNRHSLAGRRGLEITSNMRSDFLIIISME